MSRLLAQSLRLSFPAALLWLVIGNTYADEIGYIFEIPAERSAQSDIPLGDYITASLAYADPVRAAEDIKTTGALDVIAVTSAHVVVGISRNALTTAIVDESDLAASFVIDFDEDAVSTSAKLLRDQYGEHPAPEEIEHFVFEFISDKNYLGSFDFASKVARTRSGDCTEHAVLLAALARAHGLPARLILGVVLVAGDDNIDAYGHAWTEVYVEDTWLRLDGTAPAALEQKEASYYLPFLALDDEGPGYGLDVMRLTNVQPARISEIQAAKP